MFIGRVVAAVVEAARSLVNRGTGGDEWSTIGDGGQTDRQTGRTQGGRTGRRQDKITGRLVVLIWIDKEAVATYFPID